VLARLLLLAFLFHTVLRWSDASKPCYVVSPITGFVRKLTRGDAVRSYRVLPKWLEKFNSANKGTILRSQTSLKGPNRSGHKKAMIAATGLGELTDMLGGDQALFRS
jgi:hypothetical protein